MTARTLLILRHASAATVAGTADHERPLTPIGRTEATRVGRELAKSQPDLVLCSTALRTRQTWERIRAELPAQPRTVVFEPTIYQGNADTLRELVWLADEDIATVLVIGHNPTVHELAWQLLGDEAPRHFPPASLATVTFTGSWPEL